MGKASELRQLLNPGGTLVMPDAYDGLSARLKRYYTPRGDRGDAPAPTGTAP